MSGKPKHEIKDLSLFQESRENLGGLILQGMKTTGGTDIDWLIEHNSKFIIIEYKKFHEDIITIPVGQLIAFRRLHTKLNEASECYFFIVGTEKIDFKDSGTMLHYFELGKWNDISKQKSTYGKAYLIERQNMDQVELGNFRKMIEGHWSNF